MAWLVSMLPVHVKLFNVKSASEISPDPRIYSSKKYLK